MTLAHRRVARWFPFALWPVMCALAGCQTPIETGASAKDADALIALLHSHHVGASKRPGARVNGRATYDVSVLDAELATAIAVLRATMVPASDQALTKLVDQPSWIPTPSEERMRVNAAVSAKLEAAIRLWDGVVDARVQIAPTDPRPRMLGDPAANPTASVLIKHEPRSAPAVTSVQTLVAHAVPRMRPSDVAVVWVQARAARPAKLTQVGPIAVTPGSAKALRLALIASLVAMAAFVTLVAWAWRRARSRSEGP